MTIVACILIIHKFQVDFASWKALDAEIDRLVYALYGLTEEELRVVEGG
jgi:hypothetical protein